MAGGAGRDAGAAVAALLSGQGWADPYPVYDEIRASGPLVRVQEGFYVAAGYDAADAVLRDHRMLVPDRESGQLRGGDDADPLIGASILRANPPDHARMRRLAAAAFTPRRIEAMRDAVTAQATTLTRYLVHLSTRGAGCEPFDFVTEFGYPLPIRVICALLGVPADDQHWFREQAAALTATLEPVLTEAEFDEAVRARARLDLYLSDLVQQRREQPRDDLVTVLTAAHDADGASLSREELIANLVLLLVAGFETTTNLLGNGLAILLERPDIASALRADPSRVVPFVEEVLRYDAPVQLTTRWCREPVEVHGVRIEPYSQVLVLLGGANRDPARYPRPAEFDLARPDGAAGGGPPPLSFGAGGHYCLGAALARMEAQIAFGLLVRALPGLALVGPPLRRARLTLRGYVELPVVAG